MVTMPPVTRTLTTSEAAVLALLGLGGAGSGYELTKRVGRAIGHVWAPARSQLYALLPRLVADGLVRARTVRQETRPDKQVYTLTQAGRAALDEWLADDAGGEPAFHLRLFVGSLMPTADPRASTSSGSGRQRRRDSTSTARSSRPTPVRTPTASTGSSCAGRSSAPSRTSPGPTGCSRS